MAGSRIRGSRHRSPQPLSGKRAVHTASPASTAPPHQHDTVVLAFLNDPATIEAAFADSYRTTILANETDPNKLHDLQADLDACQVAAPAHVDDLVARYLTGDSRAPEPTLDRLRTVPPRAGTGARGSRSPPCRETMPNPIRRFRPVRGRGDRPLPPTRHCSPGSRLRASVRARSGRRDSAYPALALRATTAQSGSPPPNQPRPGRCVSTTGGPKPPASAR